MIVRLMLMGVLAGGLVTNAYAVDDSYYNASDLPRMQPYCKARLLPNTPKADWDYWRGQIGQNFADLHHYCAALNYMNRYWGARNAKDRSYLLSIAMNNLNYMVKAEKPDFALRSELYSSRGEVFKLSGKPVEAERDLRHAVELGPKMTRPYLQLISLYDGMKRRGDALEVATSGLRHNPDSKALQQRYLQLGGKKPFPEPIVDKVAEPVSEQSIEASSQPEIAAEPSVPNADLPESEPAVSKEPVPPIGTPSNPYCRFCP